ncbi:adenosylcobinamide-phosphate synthase [Limimonas halophila]|uniref:Adenosylcobinamide-phosphate synthase n=1 Tax=Limimonas halophila TaxID=1082479 RepID=A0A1G7R9I7_9PROT|nr:cobalamin biosynthesis protein [Limimonas halophila]SDG06809.1 adenosylcobinamide-phosphate synthase [Limimonas halophila]
MDFFPAPGAFGASDPLFILLAALALEAYAGDFVARLPWLPHPRGVMARAAADLERRLNRPQRGRNALIVRGAAVAVGLGIAALASGAGIELFTRHFQFAWILEVILLVPLIGQRATGRTAGRLSAALDTGRVADAREHARVLAGDVLDPQRLDKLDARGIAIAAIGGLAERYASAVVAPIFWYIILGLPGVFLQQGVRVVAAVVATGNRPGGGGYDPAREGDFAFAAVRLNTALEWIPDKIAGLLIILAAAFVPTMKPQTALRRLKKAPWWSIGALGGALNLPARRDRVLSPAGAPSGHEVGRALAIYTVACVLDVGLVALITVLYHGL